MSLIKIPKNIPRSCLYVPSDWEKLEPPNDKEETRRPCQLLRHLRLNEQRKKPLQPLGSGNMIINVQIEGSSEKPKEIKVSHKATMREVKLQIAAVMGIPLEQLEVAHSGMLLEDDKRVMDYELGDMTDLFILLKDPNLVGTAASSGDPQPHQEHQDQHVERGQEPPAQMQQPPEPAAPAQPPQQLQPPPQPQPPQQPPQPQPAIKQKPQRQQKPETGKKKICSIL